MGRFICAACLHFGGIFFNLPFGRELKSQRWSKHECKAHSAVCADLVLCCAAMKGWCTQSGFHCTLVQCVPQCTLFHVHSKLFRGYS